MTDKFSYSESGDVSIWHVWATLRHNWKVILSCCILALVVALTYIVLAPPTYEAKAQIRIGQVGGHGLFEAPDSLAVRLMAEYGIKGSKRPLGTSSYLKLAKPRRDARTSTIELTGVANHPTAAINLLQRIYDDLLERHGEAFRTGVAALESSLESLDHQLKEVSREYAEMLQLLEHGRNSDPAQLALLAIQRGNFAQLAADLNSRRPKLIAELQPPSTQPTMLIGRIYTSAEPSLIKNAMILIGSLIFGMVAGVIYAFCLDYCRRNAT
jgi:Uncharacterized protein involved in exopolysaccharide biosynthesis